MGGGLVPAGHGVAPGQVAEIIVTLDGGPGRRGSGYRVGPTAVLTAAHVIDGAASVRVRFDADWPGEWTAEAITWWADPRSDLAVLTIAPRPGEPAVAAARFGRIGGDRAAVLVARAVGFPRFKLKTDDGADLHADPSRYRDSHQSDGSVAVLSNRREGTLELTVPPPGRDPDPAVSPWEGMSGTAVWVGDRIVGVIATHHRSDGLGRLAAARLDLALAGLDQGRQTELRTLLGLPEVLPDVVPPSTGEWVRTAYQTQVRDIAPDQLLDREVELDELVAFCAGDQPYAWWQAGPWAGKSALMSWFTLHPPAGVDVVSFFVTARLAGQSDSNACTDALIEQLAALLGESPSALLTVGARRGTMLRLLHDAADRSREAGRRLLLVIDGLDEDSGTATGTVTGPSIAALLPRRPPPEVRVLVASRPDPPIPDDVADDHPLRTITRRQLDISEHARDVERRAKHELTQLLAGAQLQRDVLGFITAAGGGLTLGDLAELTQQPPYEIEGLLGGLFGRSVGSRIGTPSAGYPDEQVYLFTHETLRLVAEQQYGSSLTAYRNQLHTWADSYRQREWPRNTPYYLLRRYPRILASNGDLPRLVACATDQVRHDRMRDLTGGDALAFTEISTAQQLILAQPDPDLTSLALLAVQRDHLTNRNNYIPTNLPAVWAMLGQPARAEALVTSIPQSSRRFALINLVSAVAACGDYSRAEAFTAQITDPELRAQALAQMAKMVAATGDHHRATELTDQAETLTTQITTPVWRGATLAALVEAAAAAGDHHRATELTSQAETLVKQITDPEQRPEALANIAKAVAVTGDQHRVTQLTGQAETLTTQITDLELRAHLLVELAWLMTVGGDYGRAARLSDEAEGLIEQITDPELHAVALASLASTLAATGDHNRAAELASKAETLIAQITHPFPRAETLTLIATILVKTCAVSGHVGSSSSALVRARRLLAEALVTGTWADVVAGLARVDQGAAIILAEEVQVRWNLNAGRNFSPAGGRSRRFWRRL